eukprot:CAMPEP_0113447584 /NCGR_PEP_ID=MMETSP0014_2-20120614/4315_1 /TAXON_ID=2857 /ORGANISM="Nitzschia sp." /LENGTH=1015 /DNA_ID=CAMNT_0000338747 /DNA_START=26 /DNA_END=3073 /DNA_ORIENTATION=+ /assembly_acc=CAM_ASM_000159
MTTSSSNGSASVAAAAAAGNGPTLSDSMRRKIADTVSMSRVTIVVGPTGCGKSTLVPSALLDTLKGQVLCSQPRRLAVVAISKRVAQLRDTKLGSDEVGYHVGNHNLSTKKTRLLFTTAGILLEELRKNGVEALTKYSCTVIDECHERSPESDLSLALIRDFMKKNRRAKIRLILMSATFDSKRYIDYFKRVPGCDTIDIVNLESAQSFEFSNKVVVHYLDNLPLPDDTLQVHRPWIEEMRKDPQSDLTYEGGKELSPGLLSLTRSLVTYLDNEEPSQAPFMVFAPTYMHLEQLYHILSFLNNSSLQISVLHSAVDIEDCIRTMTSRRKGKRNVFLASAIAESSVTVPGVSCVIDLCRSLQVRWEIDTRKYVPRTTWSSKSIANQRKGRTGRTNPGRAFRLVTESFFKRNMRDWEVPQLTINSCHNELLKVVTADDRATVDDPRQFFASCMDAPDVEVVEDAVEYLVGIDACRESLNFYGRSTSEISPTHFGTLLSAMAMSVEDAKVVLQGGQLGLLYETLAFIAIIQQKPSPIVHVFGDQEKNYEILARFLPDVDVKSKFSVALANLSAYIFWDINWNQPYNKFNLLKYQDLSRSSQLEGDPSNSLDLNNVWTWTEETEDDHISWCNANNLNPTSMRSISETIETTINVLFLANHEPDWLRCSKPMPRWRRSEWVHADSMSWGTNILPLIYGNKYQDLREVLFKLASSQSAARSLSHANAFHGTGASVSREVISRNPENQKEACMHFLAGRCKFGASCRLSHSPYARRPQCRFSVSGTCSNPNCIFSHEDTADEEPGKIVSYIPSAQQGPTVPLVPIIPSLILSGGALEWFIKMSGRVFLLGEGNFEFTKALTALKVPPSATSVVSSGTSLINALTGVNATKLHLNPIVVRKVSEMIRASRCFAWEWNFPFTGGEEDAFHNELLILQTFQSLALLGKIIPSECGTQTFAVSLHGDQLSRWNVLRSAGRAGWELVSWCDFDYKMFPNYKPRRQNGDTFPVDKAKFYVFELQPQGL